MRRACDGPSCYSELLVTPPNAEKLPARWLCPICEMNERDAMTTAQASQPTSPILVALARARGWSHDRRREMGSLYYVGESAFDADAVRGECPYAESSDEWAAWMIGWHTAYERNS